jgi:hypothetical protein
MIPNRPHIMSLPRIRSALNWSAVLILLVGLGSAVLIWRAQDRIERDSGAAQTVDPAGTLSPLDSRKHVRDVELYYGKLGVLMEEAEQLFQGKTLAKTIAFLSAIAATALFLAAARSPDLPSQDITQPQQHTPQQCPDFFTQGISQP